MVILAYGSIKLTSVYASRWLLNSRPMTRTMPDDRTLHASYNTIRGIGTQSCYRKIRYLSEDSLLTETARLLEPFDLIFL